MLFSTKGFFDERLAACTSTALPEPRRAVIDGLKEDAHYPRMTGVSLLYTLAAICGIVAAGFWFRVALTLGTIGEPATGANRRALSNAATSTAMVLVLAAAGVLLPLFADLL